MPSQAVLDLLVNLKDNATKGLDSLGGSLGSLGTIAGGVALAGVAALGAAVVGISAAALDTASQVNQAANDMQASLGLTADEAERMGDLALKVWGENWGSSIEDVSASIITVRQQMKGLAEEELQSATTAALALRDSFGVEVAESTNAANTLMKNFGLTSQQAFDFITKGQQEGLNASGDLLETIGEYSTQFSNGGASAEQFFSLLETGMQGGMLGTDKAADAFKEFRVRIQDGSKLTSESLTALGINADSVLKGLADGTIQPIDAWNMVNQALRNTKDESVLMQAGVGLLGTQFEDLGTAAVLAMDTMSDSFADVAGATDSLNAKYDNLGAVWEGIKRQALVALEPMGAKLLELANDVMPAVQSGFDWLKTELPIIIDRVAAAFSSIIEGVRLLATGDFRGGIFGLQEDDPAIGALLSFRETILAIVETVQTQLPAILGTVSGVVQGIAELFNGEGTESANGLGLTFRLLGETVTVAMELIRTIISQVLPAITAFWNEHGAQIMQIAKAAFDYVVSVINVALTLIKGIITVALAAINDDWAGAWEALQQMSAQVVLRIGDAIKAFLNLIASFFNTSLAEIGQTWRDNWDSLVSIVTSINWVQLGSDVIAGIVQGVRGASGQLMSTLRDLAGSALAAAKNALGISSPSQDFADNVGVPIVEGIMQGMTTTLPELGSLIKNTATAMLTTMHTTVTGGADTLADAFQGIVAQAGAATGDITDVFQSSDIAGALYQLGQDALAGFSDGIVHATKGVLSVINSTANTVEDAFKDAFGAHSPATRMVPIGESVMQGILLGVQGMWPAMESEIGAFSADLIDKAASIGAAVQRAISGAFGATASIDRQLAANLDKLADVKRQADRDFLAQNLDTAKKAAEAYADPKTGAAYFKMISDQLFEVQKLSDQYAAETSADERKRLAEKLILIRLAQEAERSAFEATQQNATSPLQSIAANIQSIIQGMSGVPLGDAQYQVYTQLLALYDQLMNASRRALGGPVSANQPYWVGERGPELFMPQQSGAIVPNGAAGAVINLTFNLPPGTPQQLADLVIAKIDQRMKGRR